MKFSMTSDGSRKGLSAGFLDVSGLRNTVSAQVIRPQWFLSESFGT